jgi:hypothetical protein
MPRRSSAPRPAGGRRGRPPKLGRSEADDLAAEADEADALSRPTESYEAVLHGAKVFTTRAIATPALLAAWAAREPRGLELLDQLATTASALQHHQDEAAVAGAELRAQRVDRDLLLARMVTWRTLLRAELVRAAEHGAPELRAAARMVLGQVPGRIRLRYAVLRAVVAEVRAVSRAFPSTLTDWLDDAGLESIAALDDACDDLRLEADQLSFRRGLHGELASHHWTEARRLLTLLRHHWERAKAYAPTLPDPPPTPAHATLARPRPSRLAG